MGLSANTAAVTTRASSCALGDEKRALVRTVLGGTTTMREAGETYLPRFQRELATSYQARLGSAVLTNVLKDAIDNVVARPFSRPIQVTKAPEKVKDWLKDIDLQGNDVTQFGREVFLNGVTDGLAHVLVDYLSAPDAQTLADENAAGVRPFLIEVKHANLIAAYRELRNGKPVVTHARILEQEVRRKGFGEVSVLRVRCFDPGRVTVFEQESVSAAWKLVEDRPYDHDFVPLFTYYCGRKIADYVIDPPFLDLAYMNVQHWQLASGYHNALDRCNFAMLAVEPIDGAQTPVANLTRDDNGSEGSEAFEVGPDTVLVGKWYYCEPKAASIKETAARLKSLKNEMRLMGLDPMMPKDTGGVSATERAIDESKAQSQLVDWATSLGDTLDEAVAFMMEWAAVPGECSLTVNTDFQLLLDSQDIASLIAMRDRGDLSRVTLWDETKRRGLLGPKFSPEDEEARLETEAPDFAAGPIGTGTINEVDPTISIKGRSAAGIGITN